MPDPETDSSTLAPWKATLAGIPSVFGRLVYLHSLDEQSDRLIGHSHHQIFTNWLTLGLAEQIRELRQYVESGEILPNYHKLVPPNARDVERQLYLTDMETLLELLRVESGPNLAI